MTIPYNTVSSTGKDLTSVHADVISVNILKRTLQDLDHIGTTDTVKSRSLKIDKMPHGKANKKLEKRYKAVHINSDTIDDIPDGQRELYAKAQSDHSDKKQRWSLLNNFVPGSLPGQTETLFNQYDIHKDYLMDISEAEDIFEKEDVDYDLFSLGLTQMEFTSDNYDSYVHGCELIQKLGFHGVTWKVKERNGESIRVALFNESIKMLVSQLPNMVGGDIDNQYKREFSYDYATIDTALRVLSQRKDTKLELDDEFADLDDPGLSDKFQDDDVLKYEPFNLLNVYQSDNYGRSHHLRTDHYYQADNWRDNHRGNQLDKVQKEQKRMNDITLTQTINESITTALCGEFPQLKESIAAMEPLNEQAEQVPMSVHLKEIEKLAKDPKFAKEFHAKMKDQGLTMEQVKEGLANIAKKAAGAAARLAKKGAKKAAQHAIKKSGIMDDSCSKKEACSKTMKEEFDAMLQKRKEQDAEWNAKVEA